MQFITTLFGASGGTLLNAAFSLGIVLTLVVLLLWVLKLISTRGQGLRRRRLRRLSIVESAVVDGKRRVVIVRRDDVEHVILTGGPQDVVIESGIPASQPEPQAPQRRPASRQRTESDATTAPAPDATAGVPRETLERLDELARPAPLKPRGRAAAPTDIVASSAEAERVFPKRPQLRIDNSAEPEIDSANTATDGNSVAHADGSGRIGRFARRVRRGDA